MHELISLIEQHYVMISAISWYLFSSAMSQMPPLPENASWFAKWVHDTAQVLAANPNKFSYRQNPTTPSLKTMSSTVTEK